MNGKFLFVEKKKVIAITAVAILIIVGLGVALLNNSTEQITAVEEAEKQQEKETIYISTAGELADFRDQVNRGEKTTANVYLTADIDLSDYVNWIPIGIYDSSHDKIFKGTFNGQGYAIKNMTIDEETENMIGLFSYVEGTIKNLGIENCNITGYEKVGGIVGLIYGDIENCYTDGKITGYRYVGGIVGYINQNSISKCYNNSSITGSDYVGGIVGYVCEADGYIEYCYNKGTVSGRTSNKYVGGIIGYNESGSARYCYNVGQVTNGYGAFGGGNADPISDCYYLSDNGANDSYATAKTSSQMQTDEFINLLGGSSIWKFNANTSAYAYPILEWENTEKGIVIYEESDILYGDVDESGGFTSNDSALVIAYTENKITLTEAQITKADVNGDGQITKEDAELILAYVLDNSVFFPVKIVKNKTVKVGDITALKVHFYHSTTNKNITWSSSDSSVVSVDGNGKVTANKVGNATIIATAEDGNYIATCDITVEALEVPTITVAGSTEIKEYYTNEVQIEVESNGYDVEYDSYKDGKPYSDDSGTPPITDLLKEDGNYEIRAKTCNGTGYSEEKIIKFTIDKTPPTAPTIEIVEPDTPGTNGWYTTNVKVKATEGTDNISRTRDIYIEDYMNNVLVQDDSSMKYVTITLSEEGTHIVKATNDDAAGNLSKEKTLTVKVDKNPPSQDKPDVTATSNSITATNNQKDKVSGIQTVQYALYQNGEMIRNYQDSNEFIGLASGTYQVRTKATDVAGNSIESNLSDEIETNSINVGSLTLKHENGSSYVSGTWTDRDVYVELNVADTGTTTYASAEGSAQRVESTNESVIISAEGTTTLVVTTKDEANNEQHKSYIVKIDKTAPEGMKLTVNGEEVGKENDGEYTYYFNDAEHPYYFGKNVEFGYIVGTDDFSGVKDTWLRLEEYAGDGWDNYNCEDIDELHEQVVKTAGTKMRICVVSIDNVYNGHDYDSFSDYLYFRIDDAAPTVTANPASSETYAKNYSIGITISEDVTDENLYYIWSKDNTIWPNSRYWTGTPINDNNQVTINESERDGEWYLWVGSLTDNFGNVKSNNCFGPYYFDNTQPTCNITTDLTSNTTTSDTITYTFTFSEDVTGFIADDITVTNGTKGTFTKIDEKTYTLVVTNNGEETTQIVSINEDVCQDSAGNGNKAAMITVQIEERDLDINARYNIETYTMNIEGEYVKTNTESKIGTVGEEITISIETPQGFELDETNSIMTRIIAEDGNTVFKVYFARKQYTLGLTVNEGIASVTGQGTYYYEQQVNIDATVSEGYTWANWTGEGIEPITNKNATITMPANNIVLKANATKNIIPNAEGLITFEDEVWKNGLADVGMTTESEYKIQYRIGETGEWVTGNIATGLNLGDVIYARLTDGTNVGEPATYTVKDTKRPAIPTITVISGEEINVNTYTGEVVVKISQGIDTESGAKETTYTINGTGETTITQDTNVTLKENGEYIIRARTKDKADNQSNEAALSLTITDGKYFTSDIYLIESDIMYISKISPNTTCGEFAKHIFTNMDYTVLDVKDNYSKITSQNGVIISNEELVKTGDLLQVEGKQYKLVVTGDINYDGECGISDLSKLKRGIIRETELVNIQTKAADINYDKEVDVEDLSRMVRYIIKLITI